MQWHHTVACSVACCTFVSLLTLRVVLRLLVCLFLDCADVDSHVYVQGILRVGLGDEIGQSQFMATPLMLQYRCVLLACGCHLDGIT